MTRHSKNRNVKSLSEDVPPFTLHSAFSFSIQMYLAQKAPTAISKGEWCDMIFVYL